MPVTITGPNQASPSPSTVRLRIMRRIIHHLVALLLLIATVLLGVVGFHRYKASSIEDGLKIKIELDRSSRRFFFNASIPGNDTNFPMISPLPNSNSTFRILYVVTSGGKSYGQETWERFTKQVLPVLRESIESLVSRDTKGKLWSVDVFLILGSGGLDLPIEQELRESFPPGVGLEIWPDAIPMGYHCKNWVNKNPLEDPIGHGNECSSALRKRQKRMINNHQSSVPILPGPSQLARQHRYVIKDKLRYYDFIMAWEDDMVVKKHHVEQHLQLMRRVRQGQRHASTSTDYDDTESFWMAPMKENQWKRLRPGFLRVEVLQDKKTATQAKFELPISSTVTTESTLDANLCCHTNHRLRSNARDTHTTPLYPSDLMLWETGILGTGIRRLFLNETNANTAEDQSRRPYPGWVALLSGPNNRQGVASYWPGEMITPRPVKPGLCDPKYIAQSAGWMASPFEIMDFHMEFCPGSFLPPFDAPNFKQDGFWRNNVEFWSGGMQLWCRCGIQRFISMESDYDFGKHLLYHSSNNKQVNKPRDRLVLSSTLLGQLRTAQEHLESESISSMKAH